MNERKPRLWIPVVAVLLVASIIAGIFVIPKMIAREPVKVYSFDMMGYRNLNSSGTESYGMVSTDRVQSAYLSETQKVVDILVEQGQPVYQGDVLFTYDTTLSALQIERKELDIQQLEMNLKTARSDLKALKSMKPMVIPDEPKTEENKVNDNSKIPVTAQVGKIYNLDTGKGTQLKPYYVWLKSDSSVTQEMIYEYLQARNKSLKEGVYVYVVFRYSSGNQTNAKVIKEYGMRYWLEKDPGGITASATNSQWNLNSQSAQLPVPSAYTAQESGQTAAPVELTDPGKPELLASDASVTADSVTLASPAVPQDYTLVYRMRGEAGQWGPWQVYETFDALQPSTTYFFQAGFVDPEKGGEPVSVSDEVSITTGQSDDPSLPSTPPAVPESPFLDTADVTVTARSIILREPELPAQYENVTVEYQRSSSASGWLESPWQSSQIFDGLQPNTTYYFRARFVTQDGSYSDTSNVISLTTKMDQPFTVHMRFFDPSSRTQADNDDDSIIWNSGYTASELTSMKAEKTAQIEDLQFQIKIGKAELKIMQKELDSGEVVADFDGVVSSVLEPEDAMSLKAPLVKLVGGGGFYVEGSVSELDLNALRVGQLVTVTSWENYTTYDGIIVEIGEYPTQDENYFSFSGSNLSYYPYKVFIDESADLQEGTYVSMTYQLDPTGSEGSLYLENAFIRRESGSYYVYIRGDDGLLKKQPVLIGDASDGYMTEILSGLSEEDYIAFPYGKAIKEGAPTVEGAWEDLYGY